MRDLIRRTREDRWELKELEFKAWSQNIESEKIKYLFKAKYSAVKQKDKGADYL